MSISCIQFSDFQNPMIGASKQQESLKEDDKRKNIFTWTYNEDSFET